MEQSRAITRKSASNLALAFILLPKEKRDAMSALYAFCREVDDVADEETVPATTRRTQLQEWREDIKLACENGKPKMPVNQELQPVIQQYNLPFTYFDELIRGCEMDLEISRYETYEDLEQYCYRVASVVGLLSIEIFGYHNPACLNYAVYLGKALQFTNILRDVRNDAERGRIYLPSCELKKHKVLPEEILRGQYSERFYQLATEFAQRTRNFYHLANKTLPSEDRRSMMTAELMGAVYWQLFSKLEQKNYNVFGPEKTRLTKLQKAQLILRTWYRLRNGATIPNYGE